MDKNNEKANTKERGTFVATESASVSPGVW
jgi:hypothetical protein